MTYQPKMNSNQSYYRVAFSLLLLITFSICLMPSSGHPNIPHFDKLIHFSNYFALAFLSIKSYSRLPFFSMLFPLLFLLGAIIEVLQGLTGYRTFSILDMMANGFGLLLAGMIFYRSSESNK